MYVMLTKQLASYCGRETLIQVSSSSLLRKIEKIQNMMYHCSQLAIAVRGEQWLDTKRNNYNNNTIKTLSRINYYRTIH